MKRTVLLLTLALLAFAGCEKKQENPKPVDPNWKEEYAQGPREDNDPELLIGEWVLKAQVNSKKQTEKLDPFEYYQRIEFLPKGKFTGTVFCNVMNGDYTAGKVTINLHIGPITKKNCPVPKEAESRYLRLLSECRAYSVSTANLRLYYNDNQKFLLFERKQP